MINSRGNIHPEWINTAINSVKKQMVACELIIIKNLDNKRTIGQCWNEGVRLSKGDWVFFLGDDDFISDDYLLTLSNLAKKTKSPMVTTYRTVFREDVKSAFPQQEPMTGMWKKEYLEKYPFNEKLKRGIDGEYIDQFKLRGDNYSVAHYHYGYFYRKHSEHSCAGDIKFIENPKYYFITKYPAFIEPIAKKFENAVISPTVDFGALDNAEVVWCDFATENAVTVANYECKAKKILRIHAFDAYSEAIKYINFDKFDEVIFVGKHIQDYVTEKYGVKNSLLIPNGVDLDKFTLSEKVKNNKIAYAGHISRTKGIGELLLVANSLPSYEFHIAGRFIEDDVTQYLNKKLPKNVFLNSWQYNLNEFFKDKTYIINTSLRESQAMSLLEGMACGLKPIVNDWIGAKEIYGEFVYKNINDIRRLLAEGYEPEKYRKFVKENYSSQEIYPQIEQLFKETKWQET